MAHETERSGGEPAADNGQVAATPESRREVGRRNLNRQIAQSQQEMQMLKEQNTLLQKQLGDEAARSKQALAARQEVEKQFSMLQASTQR